MNRILILSLLVGIFSAFALAGEDLDRSHETTTAPSTTRSAKIRIVLAGDSTVNEGAGWGPGFMKHLDGEIECINLGRNGRSSKSYYDEGWWTKCVALKPDYVLIQFGHNDQPGKGPQRETDPETTYRANMERYVDQARGAGIEPVLVTSLSRREWDDDGTIHSSLARYAEVVKQIAAAKKVPLIDLHGKSVALYETLGVDGFDAYSLLKDDGSIDKTHLNAKGSDLIGKMVADELKTVVPELAGDIH